MPALGGVVMRVMYHRTRPKLRSTSNAVEAEGVDGGVQAIGPVQRGANDKVLQEAEVVSRYRGRCRERVSVRDWVTHFNVIALDSQVGGDRNLRKHGTQAS